MSSAPAEIAFRPLYQHVRERLVERMIDGRWKPGAVLPSEQQLASELGVGQGTVRKALDALAQEKLLIRKQGKGTMVAFPEEARLHFQFYRLRRDDGEVCLPQSTVHALRKVRASPEARQRLGLKRPGDVWEIERARRLSGELVTAEWIVLPAARFPKLDQLPEIPNNVYALYITEYGQIVTRATERLKSRNATKHDCELLGCKRGTALLEIDRVAFGLDGAAIEWRVSRCLTEHFHYLSELR